jgi:ubiquinone/menaquinone biosynthesis C-methylase UbiE
MSDPREASLDDALRQRMLRYYDERAPEYDEAYTRGTGTSSMARPDVFVTEAAALGEVVARTVAGRVLDLACGTGYWFPHYARRCSNVTMFDQSPGMLRQARQRIEALDGAPSCMFVQGDVFESPFEAGSHDFVLVGFLLSHVTPPQERHVFGVLRRVLRASGRFLILESAWTAARAEYNRKVERQIRSLDAGTRFEIYKRYIAREDVERWAMEQDADLQMEFLGDAFCAVSGRFRT